MSYIIRSKSYIKIKQPKAPADGPTADPIPVAKHHFVYDAAALTSLTSNWQSCPEAMGRLAQLGGLDGLALALRTSLEGGLLDDEPKEDAFARRQLLYGRNVYEKKPPHSFLWFCLRELRDPFLLLLTAAGLAYTVYGAVKKAEEAGYVEGLAIIVAVLFVVLTAAVSNYNTELRFRAQSGRSNVTEVQVLRAGKEALLASTELLVGDLVCLATGSAVPADGVLVSSTDDLVCEESSLTGESKGVAKSRARPFMLAGTKVIGGEGLMLVTCVGGRTCWGSLLLGLQTERERTPLQKKLDGLVKSIGIVGSVFAALTFIVKLAYWIIKNKKGKTYGADVESLIVALLTSVALVVVAIPEGLPLAVTITLAFAMKKMLKDNNFVRVLGACETMGNATTICSDKTGTLTQNKMTVVEAWPSVFGRGANMAEAGKGNTASSEFCEAVLEGVGLNSKAFVVDKEKWVVPTEPEYAGGNKTECAIFSWAINLGLDEKAARKAYPIEKAYPFNSATKRSAVLLRRNGVFRMYLKGAAEKVVAEYCSAIIRPDGRQQDLTSEERKSVTLVIEDMVSRGLRCIGLAFKDYPTIQFKTDEDETAEDPDMSGGFVLVAIIALKDPLRPDVLKSVQQCQQSGIIVRMVTGDHPKTAEFIAAECGIRPMDRKDLLIITGDEFREMDPAKLAECLPRIRIMARSTPQDKERLVNMYMKQKHIVAVTGDGANDALALKEADVGLAMGIQGTDVAKEASDIIILDDSFASIVQTVKWGRSVYDNIRKFVQFQVTINIVALVLSFIGAVINSSDTHDYPLSFTPLQLLWMNIIMDSGAAIIFSTEHPNEELLQRKPYRRNSKLISPTMWKHIVGHAVLQLVILTLMVLPTSDPIGYKLFMIRGENTTLQLKSCVFNTFVFLQIFNSMNCRRINDELNVFQGVLANPVYPVILSVFVFVQIIFVTFIGKVGSVTAISFEKWFISIALGFFSLPAGILLRFIPFKRDYGFIESSADLELAQRNKMLLSSLELN